MGDEDPQVEAPPGKKRSWSEDVPSEECSQHAATKKATEGANDARNGEHHVDLDKTPSEVDGCDDACAEVRKVEGSEPSKSALAGTETTGLAAPNPSDESTMLRAQSSLWEEHVKQAIDRHEQDMTRFYELMYGAAGAGQGDR